MHHTPGVNPFKPMMNIIVEKSLNAGDAKALVQIARDLHYRYKDDYNVIVSRRGVEIIPDNTTIVNITIDNSTNYEVLLKYLDNIPKTIKRVEEVDMTDVQ